MLPNLGPSELMIVLVIVLIFFGVGRLPEVGGAIGKGLREFKRASSGDYDATAAPAQAASTNGGEAASDA
jgi:sec-independent protein translocase protein TatA